MRKFLPSMIFLLCFFLSVATRAEEEKDTDGDGLTDAQELILKTDSQVCDTDQDGLGDGLEALMIHPEASRPECAGLQAVGSNFYNKRLLDPTSDDSDGDRLPDGEEDENFNGWLDFNETDPTNSDTDDDGLSDGLEKTLDKDKDGRRDFALTELSNGEGCSPPPDKTDLDCDGFINGVDDDSDNDGCLDSEEGKTDRNDNGILDVWETSAKACGIASSAPAGGASPFMGEAEGPSESERDNLRLSAEVLPAKGGGACQMVPTPASSGLGGFLFLAFQFFGLLVARSIEKLSGE